MNLNYGTLDIVGGAGSDIETVLLSNNADVLPAFGSPLAKNGQNKSLSGSA